jgi:hypothetical protein
MTKTVDEKHKEGLCTVISCEEQGKVRMTIESNGLFFIECLCATHEKEWRENKR